MAESLRKAEDIPRDADEARGTAERHKQESPTETADHRMERAPREVDVRPEPTKTSLGHDIRERIERPHKGDVGRSETNEEIYQGSKQKELK